MSDDGEVARGAWGLRAAGIALVALLAWAAGLLTPAFWARWAVPLGIAAGGGVLFFALCWVFLKILDRGGRVLAVASAAFREALRARGAGVVAALNLLALAWLAASLDPEAPLRFRIQTLLGQSCDLVALLCSASMLLIACMSTGFEFEEQRALSTFAKPLPPAAYIAGKWLGATAMGAAWLIAAGVALYALAVHAGGAMALDAADARAVSTEVLTARAIVKPRPPEDIAARADAELKKLAKTGSATLNEIGEDEARTQLTRQARLEWRSVAPLGRQVFLFDDIPNDRPVSLRFKVEASREPVPPRVRVVMEFNGRPTQVELEPRRMQTLLIPRETLASNGRLTLAIAHRDPANAAATYPGTLMFPSSGLEVFYPAGTFAGNLARAFAMMWFKLAFLAMLGTGAAAVLTVPVAVSASLFIWIIAAGASYIGEALASYGSNESAAEAAKGMASAMGIVFSWAPFKAFSQYAPGSAVLDGQLIKWTDLLACAGWVGVLWTLAIAIPGWLALRGREAGRVEL